MRNMLEMKSKVLFLFLLWINFSLGTSFANGLSIIPQPQSLSCDEGSVELENKIVVFYSTALKQEAEFLKTYLKQDFSAEVVFSKRERRADIVLRLDKDFPSQNKEGYSIDATDKKVVIKARSAAGIFYGIQTLRQSLEKQSDKLYLQKAKIVDYPAFSWRAFMLDEGRYFKGKAAVMNLLDRMAELKMNVFHWHLTDDQGWRIEIKKYPKLTEVGAFRDSSEINHFHSNVFDGKPHGGFYTQDDIKEIVAYAAKRHITVVPEFEMPGHASAAIAAYPWLGASDKQIKVPCYFGVHYNAFNVADQRVITFLHDVLDEVMQLFPSSVIHIGGDELRYDAWKSSKMVLDYMKEKGIGSPAGLQVYFTNSISEYLTSKGRRMMGWNEITGAQVNDYQQDGSGASDQKLSDKTIVQFWNGNPALIKETIQKGYDIVNSYSAYTYLDYSYQSIPLRKAYEFNPVPEGLSEEQAKQVLGLGCQMWGEFIPTIESMNQKIFPRIAAYAEVGWTEAKNKNYERFLKSLKDKMIVHWQKAGVNLGAWE